MGDKKIPMVSYLSLSLPAYLLPGIRLAGVHGLAACGAWGLAPAVEMHMEAAAAVVRGWGGVGWACVCVCVCVCGGGEV